MVFERHWGIWRFWTQVHRVKVIIRTCHLGRSGHQPDISYRYRVSVYASFMSNRYESSKFTSGQRISILWVCCPVQNGTSRWSWTVFKWPFELNESNTEVKVGGLSSPNGRALNYPIKFLFCNQKFELRKFGLNDLKVRTLNLLWWRPFKTWLLHRY